MEEIDPFGGPFNGQSGRLALVDELLTTFSFSAIVETGTFHRVNDRILAS